MSDSGHTLLIGVDGGGTGCRAVIGSLSTGVLGKAEGGPANATSDAALTITNVLNTVQAAAKTAQLSPDVLSGAVAHLGLAGVMTEEDAAGISNALPFADATVTDDRPTAIVGALGDQDGFLLAIGTGTIVASSRGGEFAYVGGWGFQVSDQSSGAWLGHSALRRTMLCHDGLGAHSDLTRSLLTHFNNDPNKIVAFAANATPGDYGTLAPNVVDAARAGDLWGRAIMSEGADYIMQALTTLGFRSGDALCLTGGVGPHYAPYLPSEALQGRLSSRGDSLDGAFQLAAKHAANLQRAGR